MGDGTTRMGKHQAALRWLTEIMERDLILVGVSNLVEYFLCRKLAQTLPGQQRTVIPPGRC